MLESPTSSVSLPARRGADRLGYIVLIRIGENRALMAAFSNTSNSNEDDAPRRVPKPEAAPPGGGGKRKTRIGAGDMGGGVPPPWQGSGRLEGDSQRSVPHVI